MAYRKLELYLLKEVISKAKKDALSGKMTIYLNDYAFLNLSVAKMELLQKMCQEYDIYLEQLPPIMRVEETQMLLKEYIQLKRVLNEKSDTPDVDGLNKRMHHIKERITLGHMQLVFNLINKTIPDIQNTQDREDIYQLGYEILLELIDSYDDTKNATFIYYLNRYLISRLNVKILMQRSGINRAQANRLRKLINARSKLQIQKIDDQAIKEISEETGYSPKTIEPILSIEKSTESIALDSYEEEEYPLDLVYSTFEEDTIDKVLENNNHIEKLLATLKPIQRQIISLYYGFEDGCPHSLEEIAHILKRFSKERARQIKEEGMITLTEQVRGTYLKSIYGDSPYFSKVLRRNPKINEWQLKEILIDTIPKPILEELMENFNPTMVEILMLYYGLKDGKKYNYEEIVQILKPILLSNGVNDRYNYDEIGQILKLEVNQIKRITRKGTDLLLAKMTRRLNPQFTGNSLEYMTNYYLNDSKKRK